MARQDVVELVFKHSKCSYISLLYESAFAWVKNSREDTFRFDEEFLIDTIDFILDSSYFSMGNDF